MRALLFDMDGVLTDSFDAWRAVFNETMEEFGRRRVSKREYREKYWGPDDRSNLIAVGLGEDAWEYMKERYTSHIKDIKIFPQTERVLKSLSKKYKLGLVTNTAAELVYKTLDHFDIRKYFDAVLTIEDVQKGKPDPQMMVKACESLGFEPSEVIVVGDTVNDVLAARGAGCIAVGLKVEGDFKIKNLPDLLKFIEQTRVPASP